MLETLHGSLTGRLKMPTRTAAPNATAQPPVLRSERYRVRFDHRGQAALCAQTAGAICFVCHLFLSSNDWSYFVDWRHRAYGRWTEFPEAQRPL
ncbi:MAG: hypothetical protein OXC13_03810, partial [Caldilineaceae bacterium]|nr:hypothetical protein [Caldilineaceae bacterium]